MGGNIGNFDLPARGHLEDGVAARDRAVTLVHPDIYTGAASDDTFSGGDNGFRSPFVDKPVGLTRHQGKTVSGEGEMQGMLGSS